MPHPLLHVSKDLALPVAPKVLWDLISNTEHLNRMIGLPAVTYGAPQTTELGTFRHAQGVIQPLGLMQWLEFPFEWVKPLGYRVRRVFSSGPFQEFYGGVDIEAIEDGTALLRVVADLTPRNFLGRLGGPVVARKGVNDIIAYCKKALSEAADKPVLILPMPRHIRVNQDQLRVAKERLAALATLPSLEVNRLVAVLATSSDEQVHSMRPFVLADQWNVPRREILRLFLHATRAGLLELEWQLKCPYCRVSKSSFKTLSEITPQFHCDFCGIDYNTDLDLATELKFNVSPAIRETKQEIYCIGSPVNSPHILAQQVLAPGETRRKTIPLPEGIGEFRLRVLRRNAYFRFVVSEAPSAPREVAATFNGQEWLVESNFFHADSLELTLHNAGPGPIVAVFEDVTPDLQSVTAALVTLLPEFRRHFNAEILAPGRDVAVRRVCLLFTDLKGSTALYEQIGDATALGRVYKHFDFLRDIIQRNGGTVVKIMGDAVMAAFYDSREGLRTALEIQQGLPKLNAAHAFNPPLVIKLGLHQGPAFVVNSNDQLDYFGRTVNMAARLEHESEGGDVICSSDVLSEPGVEEVLRQFPVTGDPFSVKLNGITEETTLYRLKLVSA